MAAKRRRRPNHKLRSSFIATFSTLAAGLGGCGVAEQPPSRAMEVVTGGVGVITNPPGFSGVGGAGGVGGEGGIGGAGTAGTSLGPAGFGANPPPPPMTPCPAEPPTGGMNCTGSAVCDYHAVGGPTFDPCAGQQPSTAYCRWGVWFVEREEWTCNPPEIIDEDAGQE